MFSVLRLSLPLLLVAGTALAAPTPLHLFGEVAVSPDGTRVATLEADQPADEGVEPSNLIVVRPASGHGPAITLRLPCQGPDCKPSSLAWFPDSHRIAFVLKQPKQTHGFVYAVGADGTGLAR